MQGAVQDSSKDKIRHENVARSRVVADGNEQQKISEKKKGEVEKQSSVQVSVGLRAYAHIARWVRDRVRGWA